MSKDVTVCFSYDFDAMSVWIANFRTESPNALSRGEFGQVGAQRILDLLADYDIKTMGDFVQRWKADHSFAAAAPHP